MLVAYDLEKFGWNSDPLVKKFVTDYLDDDFSNLCIAIFLGNNYLVKLKKMESVLNISFEEF